MEMLGAAARLSRPQRAVGGSTDRASEARAQRIAFAGSRTRTGSSRACSGGSPGGRSRPSSARSGDFDLAEEAVQEAFAIALERWPRDGVPDNPGAWITTTAREPRDRPAPPRSAPATKTEALRRGSRRWTTARLGTTAGAGDDVSVITDDRLRLIFTCCHPALAPEARVALTLRTLGGLTTKEIARAFLVPEPTVAQRLVRAKRKIRDAGIPYRVPPAELLPERLAGVLAVLYLVFNEGYAATDAAEPGARGAVRRGDPARPRRSRS